MEDKSKCFRLAPEDVWNLPMHIWLDGFLQVQDPRFLKESILPFFCLLLNQLLSYLRSKNYQITQHSKDISRFLLRLKVLSFRIVQMALKFSSKEHQLFCLLQLCSKLKNNHSSTESQKYSICPYFNTIQQVFSSSLILLFVMLIQAENYRLLSLNKISYK